MYFSTLRFQDFWIKSKLEKTNTIFFQNTISFKYRYATFLVNPLTQNAYLKRPCFGEIRYGEKRPTHFLSVCTPMGASMIDGLSLCSLIPSTLPIDLIIRKRM